jgi:hypothetical protein
LVSFVAWALGGNKKILTEIGKGKKDSAGSQKKKGSLISSHVAEGTGGKYHVACLVKFESKRGKHLHSETESWFYMTGC